MNTFKQIQKFFLLGALLVLPFLSSCTQRVCPAYSKQAPEKLPVPVEKAV